MLQGIDDVAPKPGELDELGAERKRLRHAGKLLDLTQRAVARLDGEDGICDQLARVAADLRAASELDDELVAITGTLDACYAELREAASTCERYAEGVGGDPNRLGEIEERLYRLEGLLRQHGPAVEDVLAARERLAAELDALTGTESRLGEKERELEGHLPRAAEMARALSEQRRRAAERLGAAIGQELGALGMGGARVLVEVEPLAGRGDPNEGSLAVDGARLGRDGIDRVEFLISPNKGIDPKPLRKIASGGELSRALLALKRVLAEGGPAGLYVFDEVDSGVGGAVAERIGAAIADVAGHHQVLCITHLAPIAAFADAHFVVKKTSRGDVTESRVDRVRDDERVREVARMLSGATITRAGEDAARELIASAREGRDGRSRGVPAASAGAAAATKPKASKPAVEKRARR
jgi:DNA repair protein RecN (Recombination protein N)